jgi:hypothetical protein
MSDAEFLLVITATFCVMPFLCCTAVKWILAKYGRGSKARNRVWVLECKERRVQAIVELSTSQSAPVKDCSCWREDPHCEKSCVGLVTATEHERLLTR